MLDSREQPSRSKGERFESIAAAIGNFADEDDVYANMPELVPMVDTTATTSSVLHENVQEESLLVPQGHRTGT